ncbi:MAG: hypothetical protein KC736_04750 [Candidatus Moranbacteria bacterium]|nr:hypothetical protein [Candidatus Moranbacteria bacterium]
MFIAITAIYILFFLSVITTGFFVVYHLYTYTIHRPTALAMTLAFTVITTILILINIGLFLSIPTEGFTPTTFG